MEKVRGKKGKKAIWHLTLGLRDTIFAGVGVVGLMMMSFALGALAGRGDIYRAAYSWGLLAPEGAKMAQWSPGAAPQAPAAVPAASPPATPQAAPAPAPASAPAASAPAPAAAPASHPAPVAASIAPLPGASASAAKKKTKPGTVTHEVKSREDEVRRIRQEVVHKLKFQNSFDTAPKPRVAQKLKEKPGAAPAKTPAAPVRVGQFRDSKAAQAKLAELQKSGVKASLKQSKDHKGVLYTVYKQAPASPQPDKVAEKTEKTGGAAHKPKAE